MYTRSWVARPLRALEASKKARGIHVPGGMGSKPIALHNISIDEIDHVFKTNRNELSALVQRHPHLKDKVFRRAKELLRGTPQFAGARAGNRLAPKAGEFTARFGTGTGTTKQAASLKQMAFFGGALPFLAYGMMKHKEKKAGKPKPKVVPDPSFARKKKPEVIPELKWGKNLTPKERFVQSRSSGGMKKKGGVPLVDPMLGIVGDTGRLVGDTGRMVGKTVGDVGREVDRQIEKHEHPINVALGAALGGGLGVPVGAMAGSAVQSLRIGKKLQHPKEEAGLLRKLVHAKRNMPEGKELARQIRKAVNRGVLVGGGGGLAVGALMGHQIAKALKRGREAKEMAEKKAGLYSIYDTRRTIQKLAGAAKRQLTWNGMRLKVEYDPGDKRSGTSRTGEKWERTMHAHYGYIPGSKGQGDDGDAIDFYLAKDPVEGDVYRIQQLTKDGEKDEQKYMLGYPSAEAAEASYRKHMPAWAFGSITKVSDGAFRALTERKAA